MPHRPLPADPSIESLKREAKHLLKVWQAGESNALAVVREFHPHAREHRESLQLADAQLVIARMYGFASWPRLKRHLAVVRAFVWDPPADPNAPDASLVDRFLQLACLNYGNWNLAMAAEARQMLAEHPELVLADLSAACTVGDVDVVCQIVSHEPSSANRKGGALDWEPLLYCCYSRLNSADPRHSTFEVAKYLLACGADPNAGFLWRGNVPAFTALTGAFGEGEAGAHNPPHQYRDALVRLLLDAGADPNDGQALYNTGAPVSVLRLLFAYGLGRDRGGPWVKRAGDRLSPQQSLQYELLRAAQQGQFEKVKILIEHGVDINQPGGGQRRTPYEEAVLGGHDEIAEYLLQHGARCIELNEKERFASACVAGRRDEVCAILRQNPKLIEELGEQGRGEIVHKAAGSGRQEALRLLAELKFDLDAMISDHTAMHSAAWVNRVDIIRLLIGLGANPSIRDGTYNGTPLDWAEYNQQPDAAGYLRTYVVK